MVLVFVGSNPTSPANTYMKIIKILKEMAKYMWDNHPQMSLTIIMLVGGAIVMHFPPIALLVSNKPLLPAVELLLRYILGVALSFGIILACFIVGSFLWFVGGAMVDSWKHAMTKMNGIASSNNIEPPEPWPEPPPGGTGLRPPPPPPPPLPRATPPSSAAPKGKRKNNLLSMRG